MKKTLKKILAASVISGSLFFVPVANAEIYTGEGEYAMSKYETPAVAEERAKNIATRNAQEQAGIYIESYSHMKNFDLLEDEIITIASSVLKFVEKPVIKKTFMEDGDTIKIFVTVKVEIDDNEIENYLNRSIDSRTQVNSQLEELRKANAEQEKQIAELKEKLLNTQTPPNEEKITEMFVKEDKNFLANQKVEEGWKLYLNKKYREAAEIFNAAAELNPENFQAYLGRGTALSEIGQSQQALEDLNKAAELNPNFAVTYLNRGAVYADVRKYEKAIEDYNKAIELKPRYAIAYFNRGVSLYRLQRYEDAIESYTKSIELNPKNEFAYSNRGSVYDALGQFETAISDFSNAIEINPEYPGAYNNRGWAYMNLKNYRRAIQDFTKAIELNPNKALYYTNRGTCYKEMGETAKARADFKKSDELE